MKYFDLTKRCEDGSVARRRSWAILFWRGKQQFYEPKIVVVVLSYSLIKPKDVKKHLEVVPIGDNDLRRLHVGLHNHPHPALLAILGDLDHILIIKLMFRCLWSGLD